MIRFVSQRNVRSYPTYNRSFIRKFSKTLVGFNTKPDSPRGSENKENRELQSNSKNEEAKNIDLPEEKYHHQGTAPAEQGSKGYVPKLNYERVSYEYPAATTTTNSSGQRMGKNGRIITPAPVESSAWRRHFPIIAAVVGVAWAAYAYKYFLSGEKTGDDHALEPDKFTTFKITYKENVGKDLQLIELSPRNYEQYRKIIKSKESMWNGKNLWSVDVRQPEIQVVRKYTPLPMYFMQGGLNYNENTNEQNEQRPPALLRSLGTNEDEGRMVLLVKKYDDGEVSRWLHKLPVGSLIDIRGPYVGYKFPFSPIDKVLPPRSPMEDLPSRMIPEDFPDERAVRVPADDDEEGAVITTKSGFWGTKKKYKKMMNTPGGAKIPLPENIAFFAGGTGIAPILQSLFSLNPPRGFVDIYYSVCDRSEIPFPRFLLFLEKAGRAKFHFFVDNENKFLKVEDIPSPSPLQYKGYSNKKLEKELLEKKKLEEAIAVIKQERAEQKRGNKEAQVKPPIVSEQGIVSDIQNQTAPNDNIEEAASNAIIGTIQNLETTVENTEPTNENDASDELVKFENPRLKYRSILEQIKDRKETGKDQELHNQGSSIAVVCGPPGYVAYLAGRRDPANKAPIGGLLGQKGWDNTNTYRME